MNVGIIGSGGREHAICENIKKSSTVDKIYCFPGNAGTEKIAININIDTNDFSKFTDFIKKYEIDLIIVGPEKPLVNGIVDFLENKRIKVFGPNKISSQLEGSKIFTKNICKKYNIPTAGYGVFNNVSQSLEFIKSCKLPVVVKADGLAAGKGVYICNSITETNSAINEIFGGKFGKAKKILIEEFLEGEEMSYFIISDGKNYKFFGTAQDHKRVFENDKGKNTGGMGAYSPSRLEDKNLNQKILDKIIKPTFLALNDLNTSFKGFLYAGLMIKDNEPFLIEYNVRMGDPECQTILPRLKTDFFKIIYSCVQEKLDTVDIEWHEESSLCVVMCSKGYPDEYVNNVEIKNLDELSLDDNEFIFHAGTILKDNRLLSNGGRVLNFVSKSKNFKESRNNVLNLIRKLNWKNGHYRKDIGFRVID
jgi:phosphoribosylamine--glycine ligase